MSGTTTAIWDQESMPMINSVMEYTRRDHKKVQHRDERNKRVGILEELQEEIPQTLGPLGDVATHTRTGYKVLPKI